MLLAEQAREHREKGDYFLALTYAKGGDSALCWAERARALNWLGQPEEANDAAKVAMEKATKESNEVQIDATLALASTQLGTGNYATGLDLANQANQQVNADTRAELSCQVQITLAAANAASGNTNIAILKADLAVEIARNCRPRTLAEALHSLADSYHRDKRFFEAMETWKNALAIRRKCLGPHHPEVATNVDSLALTLRRINLPQLAISLHQEALKIYRIKFAADHPGIAACLHGLAQAQHRCKHFTEAQKNVEKALQISQQRLGEDHPDTWVTRFELGRMEVDSGNLVSGVQRMEHARMRLASLLGENHPTVKAMDKWRQLKQ